jgi:hypothetical protein
MINKEFIKELRGQISGLVKEYKKAKTVYDGSGLNADLKAEALQTMAAVLQLQNVAIQNLANFNYALKSTEVK